MDIIKIARQYDFDDTRVIPPERFTEWEKHYHAMKAYGEPSTHAMEADPRNIMPDATCIIVLLKSYKPYYGWPKENVVIHPHYVAYNKVYFHTKKIAEMIRNEGYAADTSSLLPKRHAAFRAGYGRSGAFGPLIHLKYGSYINFSTILTNMPLAITHNITGNIRQCSDCGICAAACPGSAIIGDGSIIRHQCLRNYFPCSGPVPDWARQKAGNMFIGCDICQSSCPMNAKIKPELPPKELVECTRIIDMLQFDKPVFKEQLRKLQSLIGANEARPVKTAATAAIIAGNSKDTAYAPALMHMLKMHDHKYVRSNAAWALGQIGDYTNELASCLLSENDPDVALEIKNSMNQRHV